jgi:hypothetical protein
MTTPWGLAVDEFAAAFAKFEAAGHLLDLPDNVIEWREAGRLLREMAGSVTLNDPEAAREAAAELTALVDKLLDGTSAT